MNDSETAYDRLKHNSQELGLDVKFSPSSNISLDITLNTDFAQAEADDEQINISRFSLFFPEKRLFFQERASVFSVNTGQESNVFYSRRIGLDDDGLIRIYGGIRGVGKFGDWDIGLINMQTASTSSTPSENLGVIRGKRRILNTRSYSGAIITSRYGDDGSYNYTYGIDGDINIRGDDFVAFSLTQSIDDSLVENDLLTQLNSVKGKIHFNNKTNKGPGYWLILTSSGENYDPGLGFDPRIGSTIAGHWLRYDFRPENNPTVSRFRIFLGGQTIIRNSDKDLETINLGPGIFLETRSGWSAFNRIAFRYENLLESFELDDDVIVNAGVHKYVDIYSEFSSPSGSLFRVDAGLSAGNFFDGRRISLNVSPSWSISTHLEIGADYQLNRINFDERGQEFSADLMKVRIRYSFNNQLSTNTFVQYNSLANKIHLNFRLRYNFKEGNDLYIVYNEGRNRERFSELPELPAVNDKTFLLKYSYTFQPTL